MVATKQLRNESISAPRPGAATHTRQSRTDSRSLRNASERIARRSLGCSSTPVTPTSHDTSSLIDGRPKTAAEKQREKRLRDDPLADLLGPLFVDCKRCGTRIKLSPKSSYDPFHWVKHRERCLRRSIEVVQEILRERRDQPTTPSRASPSSPRRSDTGSTTPSLITDEDEVDKPPGLSQRESSSNGEEAPLVASGASSNTSKPTPPLDSLSFFSAPDMLAFEDYLHRSRRLPTRLGFPELLPPPGKWSDWSWGQLRAPVYVVPKQPEQVQAPADADPPPASEETGGDTFQAEMLIAPNSLAHATRHALTPSTPDY
ncbi:hypothetical protein BC834DRAFT_349929 [Gloeopeniophorella convolvens]|nr:hypothetical protein BC834DRAFT_349929 [Gloeopeniophorella convolvens]